MNQSGNSNSTIDPNNLSVSDIDEQITTALNEVFKLLNLKEERAKEESSSESSFTTATEENEVTQEVTQKLSPCKHQVENKEAKDVKKTSQLPHKQRVEEHVTNPYQRITTQFSGLEVGDRVLILNSHRNLRGATGKVIAVQQKQVSLKLDKEKWVIQRSKKNLRKITK